MTPIDGEVAEADAVADDLRAQLAAVTKEAIRLAKMVNGLDVERFDLEGEVERLRAALEPTPDNRAAWLAVIREFLPEDEPEDQLAAAIGLAAAIAARAEKP